MIDTLIEIAKIVAAILPFFLLCFASAKVNLPTSERSRQFPMPILALIFVIVAMVEVDSICRLLLILIDNLTKWIAALANISWMPEKLSSVAVYISDLLNSAIENLNLNFWIFFVANTAIILAYMAIKKICIDIINQFVKIDSRLHTKIADIFYEFFPEKNKWCIRENYVQVRGMLKVFYYSAVVISALLMILSCKFYYEGLLKTVFYPVFGIIVVGELYYYLDGTTRREYTNDILGEDEEAYKVVNYSLLRKFLRSIFGDKLLAENTSVNNSLVCDVTTDEVINELEKSEDQKVLCFAEYFNALHKSGFTVDHNYLRSSLDMLNGKSILFNNPFYSDLIPYAFYPMNRALLRHKKVLVVLGRHAIEDDIKEWLEKGVEAVTNIPFMWNIGILTDESQELDIGIVTRSDVLNIKLHNANSEFLENVGFCVIIEPSKLISTAQIGLNLLVKKCRTEEEKEIVYCMCDKNCDGLVDAMSHILLTSLTEVSATNKHLGTSSYMCWEADDDYLHHRLVPNISRYLGVGTELSFAALKNQVSKTKWYGGEAFPVTDLRWICKQYYYDLTKYANLPTSQDIMDEYLVNTPNFWSAEIEKTSYMTVEDESYNMFEILRDFSTRTTEQGFINIISSGYLLKDYMADNASIFEADPKAIPLIVADYTRSNRNTILRLILMMSTYPVCSEILEKELSLLGITVFDLEKQLWFEIYNCYSEISKTSDLPEDYRGAVNEVYDRVLNFGDLECTHDIITVSESFNLQKGRMETVYSITDPEFLNVCVAELRSAGYIAEDEKGQKYYLGSELYGHIYQKYLPGQFFTFGGKYYEMQYLTADGQVLVRRAADHINGRPSYRQMREYVINGIKPSEKIGAQQDISGMKVVKEFADIKVNTPGYYRMEKYNDFITAKKILFEGEKNGIPCRMYRNKEILRVELPELDGKLNDNIRYTVTVLFNEIFRTIFAENHAYICAVTDDSFITEDSGHKPLTYSVRGEDCELRNNAIYIIEDSQLDLGLTVTVERNLQRIFNIVHDYLDWHIGTLEASLVPPPDPEPPFTFTGDENGEEPEKKGIKGFFGGIGKGIKKIIDKIKGWFKRKPKKGEETPEGETPEGEETPEKEVPEKETPEQEKPEGDTPENTSSDTENGADGNTDKKDKKKKGIFGWLKRKKKDQPTEEGAEAGEKTDNGEKSETDEDVEKVKDKKEKKGIFDWFKRKKKDRPTEEGAENGEKTETDENTENVKNKKEKKGIFDWFKRKKKQPAEETADGEATPTENTENETVPEENSEATGENSEESGEEVLKETVETTESPAFDEFMNSPNAADGDNGFSSEKKPYHERYYMLYGSDCEPGCIDLVGTLNYLSGLGMDRNPLKKARDGKEIAKFVEANFKPGKPDARYCDFCGAEIYGVEYETLADGRDRCLRCGKTAIKTEEEFRKLFEDVKRNMESFFGIRINAGIKVQMVNSKMLHKRLGKAYIPTPDSDGRVLGVAISDRHGYTLMIENGSPRMASMLTMAHELTHIWQYINWNDKYIRKKYGKDLRLEIYEGMAKWAEIQYAYLINEPAIAKREEIITAFRDDEYGHGFLRYRANYPFSTGTVITRETPFMNIDQPLDPDFCGPLTVRIPTGETGGGDGGNGGNGGRTPTGERKPVSHDPMRGPTERTPEAVKKYAYNLLNNDEKAVYDALLAAINSFVSEVTQLGASVTDTQIKKIVDYIQRDHPELFWFQHGATFYLDRSTHIVDKVELKYCMTQAEANSRKEKIDSAIKPFMDSVTDTMSDYELTLRIYENIINLVDYDTIGLERQKKTNVSAETPDDLRSIYGVFVNKKAVCAGYAKAFQYLMNICGIECTYVISSTHAWNLIKLEGDYYHIDVTWGDGSNTKKLETNTDRINYDCFCMTTAETLRLESHTPEKDLPLPECTAVKCNYHRRHGLYFEKYDFERIRNIVCENVKQNKFDVSLKFSSSKILSEAKKQLVDDGKFREAMQYASLKTNAKLSSRYMYTNNEERYTLSFFMSKM